MIHTLEADGIQLAFDGRKILSDIYLQAETGSITGLLGRNGEGKTCLMRIIYGDLDAEKSIRINGQSENKAFRKKGLLLYLPQFNYIPAFLSLKRIFMDFELDFSFFQEKFPEFGGRYNANAGSLSGGERRLVELYIVVKADSLFAMLDEPFTHLNPVQTEKVKELLREEKVNKGILLTDHMYRHVTDIANKLYVLTNGKLHLTKTREDIETLGYANL